MGSRVRLKSRINTSIYLNKLNQESVMELHTPRPLISNLE